MPVDYKKNENLQILSTCIENNIIQQAGVVSNIKEAIALSHVVVKKDIPLPTEGKCVFNPKAFKDLEK